MIVLGIESSCDETAASVVSNNKVLSNVIYSQIKLHKRYGGVVPEIASRKHIAKIIPVVKEALKKADLTLDNLDGIAVTQGPGLIGSLVVGINVAKTLAFTKSKPFVGVNHIYAHLTSIFLMYSVPFPFLGFVISGGHTSLYIVSDFDSFEMIGETRDDAAGEAFDKIAKLLDLGYPGGVVIDKLSKRGRPDSIKFPRAMLSKENLDFSFSGIKTAVNFYLRDHKIQKRDIPNIAASSQEAIVDSLIYKLKVATHKTGIRDVVVAGGVACNSRLREKLDILKQKENFNLYIPPPLLCTDNGAMVAHLGYRLLERGITSDINIDAFTRMDIISHI